MSSGCYPGYTLFKKEETMVQDTMGRRRPLGITIISIIAAIHGILGIIAGISTLRASAALAVIALILGILVLVLAWALWTLQRWAFWSLVVVEALYLITGIVALFARSAGNQVECFNDNQRPE